MVIKVSSAIDVCCVYIHELKLLFGKGNKLLMINKLLKGWNEKVMVGLVVNIILCCFISASYVFGKFSSHMNKHYYKNMVFCQ
jgi:hypothetical protein